jgi:hypothetical protein
MKDDSPIKIDWIIQYKTVQTLITLNLIGGTVWESNPPDLARRSQAVLKTVENTSTPFRYSNIVKSTFFNPPKRISYKY